MADVRSKTGAAIVSDFGSSSGTPIVCNQTTGDIAVLKTDQSVFIVGSDKAGISQVHYVGTTSIAADRASAAQTLTGVSIDGNAATATSSTTQLPLDNSTKIATTEYSDRQRLAQIVNTTTGTLATGTTLIPADATIPQITEGNQYMSLSITPKNASSTLEIDVVANLGSSVGNWVVAALFRDSTANAVAVGAAYQTTAGGSQVITFKYIVSAVSVSATTFTVRGGGASAGTTSFNALYGGSLASSITIKEYLP